MRCISSTQQGKGGNRTKQTNCTSSPFLKFGSGFSSQGFAHHVYIHKTKLVQVNDADASSDVNIN